MRRLLLLAFIWGWSFLFIKVAGEGMTPSTVAWARIALGAAVLHLALLRTGRRLPTDAASWRHFCIAGLVASAVPFTLLAWGEQHITSALTAVLNASTPLFTAAFAAVALRERLSPAQLGGLVVGIAGVGVAAGVAASDVSSSSLGGSSAAIGAGLCYGIAFVYMRRNLTSYPPIVAATGQLTAGAVVLLPLAAVTSLEEGIALTPTRLASIALLGAVGTGFAYVLNYRIIAEVGATRASLVTYAVPVVAVAVGIVALDERFELRQLAGALLIVTGIAAVNAGWRRGLPRAAAAIASGRAVVMLLIVLVGAAALAGCGDDGGTDARDSGDTGGSAATTASCGPDQREQLDERYLNHVLPGAPDPGYLTDPPTSGPHQPTPSIDGMQHDELPQPVQVGILEHGGVIVQYRDAGDAAALEAIASTDVVVAPNDDLPSPIVATAWTFKMRCGGVDLDALEQFVADHARKGPSGH